MAEPQKAHVLVVDDDDRIRTLLKTYLRRNGYRVTAAANAVRVRRLLKTVRFDLAILDIMMPGEDGISLTGHIGRNSTMPVLLLTALGETQDRIRGLRAGADDYLPKPFEPEELLLRIGAILRRRQEDLPDDASVGFGPWRFCLHSADLQGAAGRQPLTGSEARLLVMLARRPGRACSRADLASTAGVTERSVDVQIARLRRKIEDDPRHPRHLQTVRGTGYRLLAKPLDAARGPS